MITRLYYAIENRGLKDMLARHAAMGVTIGEDKYENFIPHSENKRGNIKMIKSKNEIKLQDLLKVFVTEASRKNERY